MMSWIFMTALFTSFFRPPRHNPRNLGAYRIPWPCLPPRQGPRQERHLRGEERRDSASCGRDACCGGAVRSIVDRTPVQVARVERIQWAT
jgi:hypothetical protein